MAPEVPSRIAATLQETPFGCAARRVLLALVAAEPDPARKAEMLATMRDHGHLPAEAA